MRDLVRPHHSVDQRTDGRITAVSEDLRLAVGARSYVKACIGELEAKSTPGANAHPKRLEGIGLTPNTRTRRD